MVINGSFGSWFYFVVLIIWFVHLVYSLYLCVCLSPGKTKSDRAVGLWERTCPEENTNTKWCPQRHAAVSYWWLSGKNVCLSVHIQLSDHLLSPQYPFLHSFAGYFSLLEAHVHFQSYQYFLFSSYLNSCCDFLWNVTFQHDSESWVTCADVSFHSLSVVCLEFASSFGSLVIHHCSFSVHEGLLFHHNHYTTLK